MPKMLITGASRGLGANIAKKFSSSYDLILQYNTSETEARALQEELVAQGAKVQLVQADLSTEEGVYVVADKILSEETPLDVLINNAGIWQEGMALDNLDWQNMQEIFIVNVFAAAKLTSLCLEKMPKDVNSNVIFFTSVATQLNIPDIAAYTAAKSAVESFMACFAKGEAPIRFNAIAPGVVPTGIHRHRFQDNVDEQEAALLDKFKEKSLTKNLGTAQQISNTVAYILDNENFTGETIRVHGGLGLGI